MNSLAAKCAAWIVAFAACAVVALYLHALRADLAAAQQQRADAQQALAARDGVISRMQQDAAARAQQQARLDRSHTAIASKLDAIRLENRRLTDENAALRAWADTPLPDVVVRLQANPALTGADDYVEHVPDGDTVHAADARAPHQR
ncbi:MAG: protein lysB [Burkholderia sp.]|jgi:LysB family phage lysis regulatory protein|uniref:Rz-like lysis system protein LysB n=1 Tax=Burkholderia sp. TaxID=36773 RepID=UPI00258B579B|nr:Rz-like lysis system protein LysB [Burkholderia sp.]MCA3778494.1 protein lysB [Burkholderia sp.]MCA3787514.1 protein lysB [Burkholderia sp.]MCA3796021.1 protein lysB [Burkholderia sp.]MCA3801551.1 protein lysB [Burkholderia sp.]MCA3811204.1 protein lysB [Burkholderia sp.]